MRAAPCSTEDHFEHAAALHAMATGGRKLFTRLSNSSGSKSKCAWRLWRITFKRRQVRHFQFEQLRIWASSSFLSLSGSCRSIAIGRKEGFNFWRIGGDHDATFTRYKTRTRVLSRHHIPLGDSADRRRRPAGRFGRGGVHDSRYIRTQRLNQKLSKMSTDLGSCLGPSKC